MPFFRWFGTEADVDDLISGVMTHPKKPQGLCMIGTFASEPGEFYPHYFMDQVLKQRLKKSGGLFFLFDDDIRRLCIESSPDLLDQQRSYKLKISELNFVIIASFGTVRSARDGTLLFPGTIYFFPTCFVSSSQINDKAPRYVEKAFRYIRSRIKSCTSRGPLRQFMTPSAQALVERDGAFFLVKGSWYDASGAKRGKFSLATDFVETC